MSLTGDSHGCQRAGCTARGTHTISILVPAKGWKIEDHAPVKMTVGIRLCGFHAMAEGIGNWLNDDARKIIEVMTRDKCPPDFDRAYLEIDRLPEA